MVFQDPRAHINPVRRIGDFMTEALRAARHRRGPRPRQHAAPRRCADVGIDDGERRLRAVPARAVGRAAAARDDRDRAAHRAAPLLADEPTTALDVTTQAEVMAILDELRRERGIALLFITHDLELAAAVCDRTAVMYAGQIVETSARRPARPRPAAPLHRRARRRAARHRRRPRTGWRRSRAARCRRSRRRTAARSPRAARYAQDALPRGAAAARGLDGGEVRCLRARGAARAQAEALRRSADAMPDAVLEARGLRKEFGELVAVDDVDLTVPAGRLAGDRRRVRLGQDDVARMLVGLDRADRRHDHRLRPRPLGARRGRRRERRRARQRGPDRLPGPVLEPRPAPERRAGARRGAAAAPRRRRRPSGAARVARAGRARRARRAPAPRAARARSPAASASGSRSRARSRPSRA